MGKIVWIMVCLLVVIGVFGVWYYFGGVQKSPVGLEDCKTLMYSGEDKIDIVFFSPKKSAEKFADKLFEFKPFLDNKDAFNVFYIDSYEPECEMYKDVALLCYSRELAKKAGSCPNDIVAVVKEMDAGIRSSAYMNVISLNSKLPLSVFAHEAGHVFSNLADEYVPATLPRGSKNCVKDCSGFGEHKDGCYEGCSENDYSRSVENGIMRTLTSSYFGKFNEYLINEIISKERSGVSGMAVSEIKDCSEQKYYLIEGRYENSNVSIVEKSVEVGCVGGNGAGIFDYQVVKGDGGSIDGGSFNAELIFTDVLVRGELGGGAVESDKSFLLKVPVVDGVEKVLIKREGRILASVGLKELQEGNRACRVI